MLTSRPISRGLLVFVLLTGATTLRAGEGVTEPSGGAPADAPRSRLTVRGEFRAETTTQKNFRLGASLDPAAAADVSDFDAFWMQELRLYPRFIVSDDINLNLAATLAQGIWGLDGDPARDGGASTAFGAKGTFVPMHVRWAYLGARHRGSRTRWYLGRQPFYVGNRIALDETADGLQIYRDFGQHSNLSLGYAKQFEGTDGVTDQNGVPRAGGGADGRDADLLLLQWDTDLAERGFRINPWYIWYVDRGNADGATYLPDAQPAGARFHPHVSSATLIGGALSTRRGPLGVEFEYNKISGKDHVANVDAGALEAHDINNGDLTGSDLFLRVTMGGPRLEIGGTFAKGSGDPDLGSGEGNLTSLRSNGTFEVTEIWEDTIALDEEGLAPGGLGSPAARAYQGLENTKVLQGHLALAVRKNWRVRGSVSIIRASQNISPWSDASGDGKITPDEFLKSKGSTELGSEFDARLDWTPSPRATLSLRGGMFFPRVAAGYLINNTEKWQEKAQELRLILTVPIPEFSLGGAAADPN